MEMEDALPLSGLQHLAFCPRQWALIHLEQAWAENRLTAEGRLLHERADLLDQSRRNSVRTVRGLLLHSARLRLTGRADIVEFKPEPFPVEYKRGKRKPTDCDLVQLCAQALCLEEMLGTPVLHGAIFYGEPRRRIDVEFTPALSSRTETLAATMHRLYDTHETPPALPESIAFVAHWSTYACPKRQTAWRWLRVGKPHRYASCDASRRSDTPMRKLLNTLHVMTQGGYLHRDGETISVKIDGQQTLRIPVHTLEGLVCWGQVSCSPQVLALCCEKDVGISFMTEQGRFLARMQGPVSGNVLLRRQQYRTADSGKQALPLVRTIVTAKVANSRVVLLRGAREIAEPARQATLRAAADRLSWIGLDASRSATIDEARGHEGAAGQVYFSVFDNLIVGDRDTFTFNGRTRRPPLDRVNALLSFLYALLRHDIEAALESVGLDPAVGFLHTDRPGRPSLALDMMEELRSALADRVALTLINRRQVQASGFVQEDGGGIALEEGIRKAVVAAWQTRKQDEIEHPFLKEKIPLGLVPYTQALLLARCLRGGLDGYPAFLWR